jgi:hypothetical protein
MVAVSEVDHGATSTTSMSRGPRGAVFSASLELESPRVKFGGYFHAFLRRLVAARFQLAPAVDQLVIGHVLGFRHDDDHRSLM